MLLEKITLWLKYRKKINRISEKNYEIKLKYIEYAELVKNLQILTTKNKDEAYSSVVKGRALYLTENRIEKCEDLICCDPFKMLLKTSKHLRKYAIKTPNSNVDYSDSKLTTDFGDNDDDYIEFIFSKKHNEYEIHSMYYYTANDIFLANCEVINGIPQWNVKPEMFIPLQKQGDISEIDNLYTKEDPEWTDTGLLFTKLMDINEFYKLKWQSVDIIDDYVRLISNENNCETSTILRKSDVTEKTADELIKNIEHKNVGFIYETIFTPYGISFDIKNGEIGMERFKYTTQTDIKNFEIDFKGKAEFVLVDLKKSEYQNPITPKSNNIILGSRLNWITLYDKEMKRIGTVEFDKWGIPVWTEDTI